MNRLNKRLQIVFSFLILLVVLSACEESFEDQIKSSVEKQIKKGKDCSVSLDKTFNLNWSELYVCDGMLTAYDISSAIGFKYSGKMVPDGMNRIIFVRDAEIINEFDTDLRNIEFNESKFNGCIKLDRKSVYCVENKLIGGESFLYLKPVKSKGD